MVIPQNDDTETRLNIETFKAAVQSSLSSLCFLTMGCVGRSANGFCESSFKVLKRQIRRVSVQGALSFFKGLGLAVRGLGFWVARNYGRTMRGS